MRTIRNYTKLFFGTGLKYLILVSFIMGAISRSFAQCPPNIDFEYGDFTGWKCQTGDFNLGNLVLNPAGPPVINQHTMLSLFPGDGLDLYGRFPRNCPNGSGHSIQLGNASANHGAEAVSYTFAIPATQNEYSLIYNYAMVLNDGGHPANLQPRLVITVDNVTDGTPLPCPLDPFIVNGSLPGFFNSAVAGPGNSVVRCKDWTTSSVKLNGLAGKTIKITFITTDCGNTLHFGYAYIDIMSQCSSSFVGATFCHDDTAINVTAPYGYQGYTWFDAANNQIGNTQVLHLSPPPLAGSIVTVALEPYNGYGCRDTLTAHLWDTLTIQPHAGRDTAICNSSPVQLGAPPLLGLTYSWSPVTGLSNPNIANPVATATTSTQYVLTVTHDGGGCLTTDTVNVDVINYDTTLQVLGPVSYCTASGQSVSLKIPPGADSVQWYRNGLAIPGATQLQYNVTQSGAYYATLFSFRGCTFNTRTQQIDIYQSPGASFSTNNPNQCFTANQFVFTNTSSPPSGVPVYAWDMGDGTVFNTPVVNYSYAQPGTYIVKMLISGDGGCADSSTVTVHVYPAPKAGFSINDSTQCFKNNSFVFTDTSSISSGTLQYTWDLGDGTILHTQHVTYSYAAPGTYTVTLRTDAQGACTDQVSWNVVVYPSPVAGISVNSLVQCYYGHQFVFTNTTTPTSANYTWNLGDGSPVSGNINITCKYAVAGDYTVRLTASTTDGCVDSTSVNVTVYPMPLADFLTRNICTNLTLPLVNKTLNNTTSTMNYMWDFGNGQTSALRSPVYSYPAPGNYTVTLSVNTAQCPVTFSTKQVPIVVDAPMTSIRYADVNALINYPEHLQVPRPRLPGNTVLWKPSTSIDFKDSYTPTFYGRDPQLYTIEIRTQTGCLTVDTQLVKTGKKIEIYVPTVFTPNGNNKYLRPILMGFDRVNYFRVYDRWGKLLFEMRSDKPGWDGKLGGNIQELQTVVWMIEAVDIDGIVHQKQGTTVLMR